MTKLDKTTLRELTPARLWAQLDPETRELAARTVYSDLLDDDSGRLEADMAIATTLRFRPVAVRKLPLDKRVGYLLRAVRADDALASTLLLSLHLGRRRPMLAAFLDRLGIDHEDGVIQVDDFEPPGAEDLAPAVEAVYEAFPHAEADVYFATLIAMEPEVWEGLIELLERRGQTVTPPR
jgi:hypothetical protein